MQKWIGRSSFYCINMIDNNCMCRGKTKKVKKYREEGEAYRGGRNPFQVFLNHPFIMLNHTLGLKLSWKCCRLPRT